MKVAGRWFERREVGLDTLSGSNVGDYVCTMERLRRLPVSVVHGGHDESFGRERLYSLAEEYIAARSA